MDILIFSVAKCTARLHRQAASSKTIQRDRCTYVALSILYVFHTLVE